MDLKKEIGEILNDHVDFAEWATDDTETTNALLSLFTKEKERLIEKINQLEVGEFEDDTSFRQGFEKALNDIINLLKPER